MIFMSHIQRDTKQETIHAGLDGWPTALCGKPSSQFRERTRFSWSKHNVKICKECKRQAFRVGGILI